MISARHAALHSLTQAVARNLQRCHDVHLLDVGEREQFEESAN
jgi:hypothetical protein